jgi:hypothetical protein
MLKWAAGWEDAGARHDVMWGGGRRSVIFGGKGLRGGAIDGFGVSAI